MKSIKPGRAPSMMGGIFGVFAICFGIVWTAIAGAMFPPMALFGVLWTGMAVVITVYNFKNATKKNRYSEFDIVEHEEEPDPLNQRFGNTSVEKEETKSSATRFCPFCGSPVQEGFKFCTQCGKELP